MTDKVRVGVIGTSWWADALYFPCLKSHSRAELAAVCGRNHERAQEMADKYDISQVFTDYRAMIGRANLDAVIIAVPDDLHYTMTMHALDAELHVLCEKPLALNAGDARAMYEKAESAGVKHMVLFSYRWHPQFRYLHELVAQGYIGSCFQADMRFRTGIGRRVAYMWRGNQHRANGGLGDLGSHLIDFARWSVGEIDSVAAHLGVFVERSLPIGEPYAPANDSAMLVVKFQNGAQATMQLSGVTKVAPGSFHLEIALYGDSGTLEANMQDCATVRSARFGEDEVQMLPVPDTLWGEADRSDSWNVLFTNSTGARYFIDAIVENLPISPNFYDGYKAQQVVDAAIESDHTGRWVSIQ